MKNQSMFKIYLIFILLFAISIKTGISQKSLQIIDSLKNKLEIANEKEKPEIFLNIGFEYSYIDSFQLGLKYLNKALEAGKEQKNNKIIASAYYNLGDLYFHFDNFPKAQFHFLKSYNIALEDKNTQLIIYSAAGLGGVYSEIGDWISAKKYVKIAIDMANKHNYKNDIPKILNLVGIILIGSNELDSAVFYFEDILKSSIQLNDSFLMGCAFNNLASVKIKQGEYSQAIDLLNNSFKINSVQEKSKAVASILGNLGKSYLNLKDYDNALKYLKMSEEIALKQGYLGIKVEVYQALSKLYESLGDYKESYKCYKEYTNCKDSILDIEKQKQIQNLIILNQQEQAEKELTILKQQAMNRKMIIYFSLFTILLLVVLFVQFFRSFKLKIKLQESEKNKMTVTIEQLNRELTAIAMNLEQKKQLLSQIEEGIKNLKNSGDIIPIRELLNNINSKFKADNYLEHNWEAFLKHFESVHPSFISGLQQKHPDLNSNDVKHCSYIKLNMGLKEIAIMNNINVKSVHMIRYRLKRKLGLDPDADLSHYINNF
jgi:tetratricopeptide (TPR) repeat protein